MHLRGLDLNLLIVLDALLEERNVTRAGRRIYLSQSAASAALAKLRNYFEDELLVQVGHHMVLTPLAEALVTPLRQHLQQTQSILDLKPNFDPSTSTRRFQLMMSDYVATVLMPHVLPIIQRAAPGVCVDILHFGETHPDELLERIELDLLIFPEKDLNTVHPSVELFRDSDICIAWSGNREIGDDLSLEQFLALPHVAVRFLSQPADSLEPWILEKTGRKRRVEVTARTFSLVPFCVLDTNRIATVHGHLAKLYAQYLPIRLLRPPIAMPQICERIVWHTCRNLDPGIAWMREMLLEGARQIAPATAWSTPEPDAAGRVHPA